MITFYHLSFYHWTWLLFNQNMITFFLLVSSNFKNVVASKQKVL